MMSLGFQEAWEETLADAMAFLHEYESSTLTAALQSPAALVSTSHGDSGEDVRAASSQPPLAVTDRRRVQKRVHRNRARDREKCELLRLREELVELETRHAQLKKSRILSKRDTRLRPQGSDELAAAWQQVAKRQEVRRRDAQNERVRLRERVTEQWNVLQCLKRIIERQLAEEARHTARVPPLLAAGPVVRSEVVGQLLATSKTMFATTSTWDTCPSMGRVSNTTIRMLSPTQLVVEVVDRRLMPFRFQAVADAYWEILFTNKCASYCFFQKEMVVEGRDTLIRGNTFGDDDDHSDSSIRRQTYVSAQRFSESDRVVITSAAQSEFIEVARHALPRTKIDEQYWHMVEDLNSSASNASYMTTFGRVVLDFQHEASYSLRRGSVLANYFNSGLGHTFEKTIAAVEDLLLQRS